MDFECAAGLQHEPDVRVSNKYHFVLQERYELFSAKVDTAVLIHEHLTAICCYRRLILFITTTKSCILQSSKSVSIFMSSNIQGYS